MELQAACMPAFAVIARDGCNDVTWDFQAASGGVGCLVHVVVSRSRESQRRDNRRTTQDPVTIPKLV